MWKLSCFQQETEKLVLKLVKIGTKTVRINPEENFLDRKHFFLSVGISLTREGGMERHSFLDLNTIILEHIGNSEIMQIFYIRRDEIQFKF